MDDILGNLKGPEEQIDVKNLDILIAINPLIFTYTTDMEH